MRTVFRGEVRIGYAQATVEVGGEVFDTTDLAACFAGQRNGLCGAGVPGGLWLVTGLHTGVVPFTVEAHDGEPDVPDSDEVVEVSLDVPRAPVVLLGWAGESAAPLDLAPATYRVRYCATGMDAGRAVDVRTTGQPVVDRYALQFWPAPMAPDRVLRVTSDLARYWHGVARNAPSPEQVRARGAEAARRQARELERGRRRLGDLTWGGSRPAGPLGDVWSARTLVRYDRPLAEAVAAASPARQRALARWTARRALVEAGLAGIDWVAAGLTELDAGRPLPPPWDVEHGAWQAFSADDGVPHTLVTSPDGGTPNCLQQAMALPVLTAAADPDPAVAALSAVHHATHAFGSPGYRRLYAELWRELTVTDPASDGG